MKDNNGDIMKLEEFDFVNYLNSNGLYYYANIIEEFLLNLKLSNIIFLNGISGLDKTKFAEYYCKYYIESNNLVKTIKSTATIGKTKTSKGFAVKRDDLKEIIPKIHYEEKCEFVVENIKVQARLNIAPRLFFKPSDNKEFIEYLDNAKNEGIEKLKYQILLNESYKSEYKIFNGNNTTKNHEEIKNIINNALNNKNYKYFLIFNNVNEKNINNILFKKSEIPENLIVLYSGYLTDKSDIINEASIIDFKPLIPIDYIQNNTQNINFKNTTYLINNENEFIDNINLIKSKIQKIIVENNENLYTILLNELNKIYYILYDNNIYLSNYNLRYIMNFMIISWKYEDEPEVFKNWRKYFDIQLIQRILPLLNNQDVSVELLSDLLDFCDGEYSYNRTYKLIGDLIDIEFS